MAATHLIGAEEYLHSTFEHDAEYVEGRIVHRSGPQRPHRKMQSYLNSMLYAIARPPGYRVRVEQRLGAKSKPPHYRIPDVCLKFGEPDEDVFTEPPCLCIEILSLSGSALELRVKMDEYLDMGVPYVWAVDPISLTGEVHIRDRIERVRDGQFRAGHIEAGIRGIP
jgi:Uma2 family endonuclease